jgi:hypothetical protein
MLVAGIRNEPVRGVPVERPHAGIGTNPITTSATTLNIPSRGRAAGCLGAGADMPGARPAALSAASPTNHGAGRPNLAKDEAGSQVLLRDRVGVIAPARTGDA